MKVIGSSLLTTSEARPDSFPRHIFTSKYTDLESIFTARLCVTWRSTSDGLLDSLFRFLRNEESP